MEIVIENRIARLSGTPQIICGNSDYAASFTFDSEWDEYSEKKAEFRYYRNGTIEHETVEFTGNSCAIPVLNDTDWVEIGVSAGDIRTTTPVRIPCIRCITDTPSEDYTPPVDIYNQLMEILAQKQNQLPDLPDGYIFILTTEGDYITTTEGDYLIAEE